MWLNRTSLRLHRASLKLAWTVLGLHRTSGLHSGTVFRLAGARWLDGRLARAVDFARTRVRLAGLRGTGRLHGWASDCGDRTG